MGLKATPHYLFEPNGITPELRIAEDKFSETWLPIHNIPDDLVLFHYTTLQGLQGIVRHRNLWLNHAASFNDPYEIEYGKQIVIEVLNGFLLRENEKSVRDFIGGILPFAQSFGNFVHHAFVVCFCESGNQLSQWRAYADKGRGYSLGFRFSEATRFSSNLENLADGKPPFIRKVIYDPSEQRNLVQTYIQITIDAIRKVPVNSPAASSIMGVQAANILLDMMLCFKHEAFKEEKEWRFFRATMNTFTAGEVHFRESAATLVAYRPTFLFDIGESSSTTFPLRSIYTGPASESTRSKSAIELFLHNAASEDSPIKLLPANTTVLLPGFALR